MMLEKLSSLFRTGLAEIKVELNASQEEKCLAYMNLLRDWNEFMNLTAITIPEKMI